jgi:hypothetical protein
MRSGAVKADWHRVNNTHITERTPEGEVEESQWPRDRVERRGATAAAAAEEAAADKNWNWIDMFNLPT